MSTLAYPKIPGLEIRTDDFQYAPFTQEGGLAKASQVFGGELRDLLAELNETMAA